MYKASHVLNVKKLSPLYHTLLCISYQLAAMQPVHSLLVPHKNSIKKKEYKHRPPSLHIGLCSRTEESLPNFGGMQEHMIKKALYNNHHGELGKVLNPRNIGMVLSKDAQTPGGENLLHYASRAKSNGGLQVEYPDLRTVAVLLFHQVDPCALDANGNTPLMHAAYAGDSAKSYEISASIAHMLLAHIGGPLPLLSPNSHKVRSYVQIKNKDKQEDAIAIAHRLGNGTLTELLKSYVTKKDADTQKMPTSFF